jgi:tetratricopeptide (TPR) repeat protein
MRLEMLSRQAEMVSRLTPDLGREWANELFTLSFQAKGNQPLQVQSTALRILIRLDPDRTLELLHQLSPEDPESKPAPLPAITGLAEEVFGILATRDGETALPLLQQEAERLGLQGHYPYAAVAYAAILATNKYWGNDNPRAIRVLQSVLDPAFERYRQASRSYFDDYEFGRMLELFAGGLPSDSVQPALRVLVKNLLATDTSKYQFRAEVYTVNGDKAAAHNAIDAAILVLGSLIKRDPELIHELESSRPELQRGLEYIKDGQQRSMMFGPELAPQKGQTARDIEAYMDAIRLSHTNAAEAIAKAEQLPDERRTSALLQIARSIASYDPERAAAVIAEIQQGNKPLDEKTSLDLVSAQAFMAAAQNNEGALHDLLQQGFGLANRIILDQQRNGAIHFFIPALAPLVHIGTRNEPDLTIPFVESLSPPGLKAELLLGAAAALSTGRQMWFGSRSQQMREKLNP